MKINANGLWIRLRQTGQVLLALVFLLIAAAPLFHHHGHKPVCQHVSCNNSEKIQLTDKCAVCDYYHHTQGQQIHLAWSQSLPVINPEVIAPDTWVYQGKYKFTLPGFTNKGPPRCFSTTNKPGSILTSN